MTPAVSAKARWMALIAAFTGWLLDGFELGLYPLVAKKAVDELTGSPGDFTFWNSIITAAFLVGAALGGWLFGWIGDRIGRVRAMLLTVLVFSVFSALCAAATEAWHLIVYRFIAALGMGGEWALGVALVMEAWPSTARPLIAGLIGAAANIGFLITAVIGYYLATFVGEVGQALGTVLPETWVATLTANGGWRLMFCLGLLPAVVGVVIRIFVPESEAWKHESARGQPVRAVDIFAAGLRRRVFIGAALAGVALVGTWASVQQLPSIAAGLSKGTPDEPTARQLTGICQAAGATLGSFLAPLLAHLLTRRLAYGLLCALSMLVCSILFFGVGGYGGEFLRMTALAGAVTASFYGWLPLYLPELFPTRLRATAQGFAYNAGRMVSAVAILSGGAITAAFGGDVLTMAGVLSFVYVLGLVMILFAPETKGRPLPE